MLLKQDLLILNSIIISVMSYFLTIVPVIVIDYFTTTMTRHLSMRRKWSATKSI